ncbi:MAG: SRPBCC family protein [Cellulomonas sp.]
MTSSDDLSQVHADFTLERRFGAPVAQVWHALTDSAARDQWFSVESNFTATEKSHEFALGGHGTEDGQWHGGPRSRFFSTYTDIVDQRRIVFTYDMWVDEHHMSTSLTTITVVPDGDGTHLTYTEQGVHLDGLDDPAGREEGTSGLLDNLGAYLER